MRKIKFMLLSLTLLAVIGGALAFKARFGETQLCTTITTGAYRNPTCPSIDNFIIMMTPTSFYTTTTNPNAQNPEDACKAENGIDYLPCQESTNKYNIG